LQTPSKLGRNREVWAYNDDEARTSNEPLPTTENLPSCLSPRPALRVYNCENCIKAWGR
jgi:hypothetical protein